MVPEALEEVHPPNDSWQWSGQEVNGQYHWAGARDGAEESLAGEQLRTRWETCCTTNCALFGEETRQSRVRCEASPTRMDARPHCRRISIETFPKVGSKTWLAKTNEDRESTAVPSDPHARDGAPNTRRCLG